MKHVSPETLLKVNKIVEELFSSMAINFLGQIPQLTRNKRISFSTNQNNLAHMFIQALGNVRPNTIEEEIFKQMISSANSYVESLKEKTKAQVQNSVSNYYIEQSLRNEEPKAEDLRELIRGHLDKAQTHFNVIANAESNKIRNVATAMKIKKMSDERGVSRPMVFFNPILDDRNDPETFRLHLLPDRVTPRIYYLDEIENKYHKKGDKWPKLAGTSPNCRCVLSVYQIGYGWDNGKLVYKHEGYNELERQRELYGMP